MNLSRHCARVRDSLCWDRIRRIKLSSSVYVSMPCRLNDLAKVVSQWRHKPTGIAVLDKPCNSQHSGRGHKHQARRGLTNKENNVSSLLGGSSAPSRTVCLADTFIVVICGWLMLWTAQLTGKRKSIACITHRKQLGQSIWIEIRFLSALEEVATASKQQHTEPGEGRLQVTDTNTANAQNKPLTGTRSSSYPQTEVWGQWLPRLPLEGRLTGSERTCSCGGRAPEIYQRRCGRGKQTARRRHECPRCGDGLPGTC